MGDVVQLLNGYKRELVDFKKIADDTKIQRARNEATLESLSNNEKAIVAKIQGLGYDPNNLDEAIAIKTAELETVMSKLRQVMPDADGNIPANANQILGLVKAEEPISMMVDGVATTSVEDMPDELFAAPEEHTDTFNLDGIDL